MSSRGSSRPRDDAEDQGTRLFAALRAGLSDVPPERIGAAFLVTDGVVHDIPADPKALGFDAPLHALITGHEGERDRRIELVEAPRFGIVGKDQTITARVLDSDGSGAPVQVEVRRDGETVATIAATVGATLVAKVPIDHAGPNVVELEVAPLPGQLTDMNNRAVVTIEGVRDKLRVLLVSGEPHQGERMWRNLLKSDANVDLVHFTILRPPEKSSDGTPINELSLIAFPVADLFGRKIRDFDLIILDRYSSQSILPKVYFNNIVAYVRAGGALLMAEGPDYATPEGIYFSPLGELAPARPDGEVAIGAFRPVISPDGAKHPVTRGLAGGESSPPAWGQWFRAIGAEVTGGVNILPGAGDKPLLVLSRADKGRVALLLSDQMWLWARGFEGGGPHLDLLRRLAHWLMKEPELEEEALRATAHGHTLTIERQSLKGDVPAVTVVGPTGETRQAQLAAAEPGLSRAAIDVDRLGLYRISDGEHRALVNVGPDNPLEFREVVSTPEKLRPLAEATGGTVRRHRRRRRRRRWPCPRSSRCIRPRAMAAPIFSASSAPGRASSSASPRRRSPPASSASPRCSARSCWCGCARARRGGGGDAAAGSAGRASLIRRAPASTQGPGDRLGLEPRRESAGRRRPDAAGGPGSRDHRLGAAQEGQSGAAGDARRTDRIDPRRLRRGRLAGPYPCAQSRRDALLRSRAVRAGDGGGAPPLPGDDRPVLDRRARPRPGRPRRRASRCGPTWPRCRPARSISPRSSMRTRRRWSRISPRRCATSPSPPKSRFSTSRISTARAG